MKYRVKFKFYVQARGHYYSEWFDTLDEAKDFMRLANTGRAIDVLAIEDEDGEVI